MRKLVALTLLAVLCAPLAARGGAEKPSVAVINILAQKGVSPQLADPFAEFVAKAINSLGKYRVLAKSELPKTPVYAEIAAKLSCDDLACQADIGRKLGVDLVVVGKLTRTTKGFLLDLQLIDTHMWRIAAGISETVLGGDEVEGVVQQLFKLAFGVLKQSGSTAPTLGTGGLVDVVFESNAPGAELILDGKPMGPLPVNKRMPPGQCQVVIEADGYNKLAKAVDVLRGYSRQTVHLELERDPVRDRITENQWFGVAASGGSYGGGLEISLFLKRWQYFYWDVLRLGGEARGAEYHNVRLGTAFGFPWHLDRAGLHEIRIGFGVYGCAFSQRDGLEKQNGVYYTETLDPATQTWTRPPQTPQTTSRDITPVDVFYGLALAPELSYAWLIAPTRGIALQAGFRAYVPIKRAGMDLKYTVEATDVTLPGMQVNQRLFTEYAELDAAHPAPAYVAFVGIRL